MSDPSGPWKQNAPPPQEWWRTAIWIGLLVLGAFGLWELTTLFPGSVQSNWDKTRLIQYVALLVLMSSAVARVRAIHLRQSLRNIAIWTGIVAVLVLGYTFQDDLEDIGARVRSALIPGYAVAVNSNEMVLSETDGGNFYVFGSVNGTSIKFLIDTGASDIVLSPADARLVGIDMNHLDYSRVAETANGIGYGAPATVANLTVGPISLNNVPLTVNQAPMDSSLLGMAFLKRMKSFSIRNHRLYLRWR